MVEKSRRLQNWAAWFHEFFITVKIHSIFNSNVCYKPFTGDFDEQIIPQSPDYVAGFATYITLYNMNVRTILAIVLLLVGVVLQPIGWMYATWLAIVSFAAIVAAGLLLYAGRVRAGEGDGGTSGHSAGRGMPGDIHGHSGQLSGGRSTAWESNHSAEGGGSD